MAMSSLLAAGLVMFAVGGIAYVFIYPLLSGDAKGEKRQADITKARKSRETERVTDAAARRKMVVLYQYGIVQSGAVVCAAAHSYGILFKRPQSRCGFSRIDDTRTGPSDSIDEPTSQGRFSRQLLNQVKRDPLRRQNAPRRS